MTQKEYNLQDGTSSFILIPDEGKMLVRKTDGYTVYGQISLGYTMVDGDVKLEVPDDYEEVDSSIDDIKADPAEIDTDAVYKSLVEQYIRERYTISDELALLRQRDSKADEYNEYYTYCEACKTRAKEELGL